MPVSQNRLCRRTEGNVTLGSRRDETSNAAGRRTYGMPKQGDVHIVKNGKSWRVGVTGNKRASGNHTTKAPAIAQGRQLATRNRSELVIHNQDGKIGERHSYGNDPFPPRG
jgi:hypothetical protein